MTLCVCESKISERVTKKLGETKTARGRLVCSNTHMDCVKSLSKNLHYTTTVRIHYNYIQQTKTEKNGLCIQYDYIGGGGRAEA